KAALACFAVAGGTVVCVDTGVFRRSTHPVAVHHRHHKKRPPPPAAVTRPIALRRPAPPSPKLRVARRVHRPQRPTTTNASAPPPPSPAPPGSTEFGPGAVGSQPASSTPAAAPRGGGGEFAP